MKLLAYSIILEISRVGGNRKLCGIGQEGMGSVCSDKLSWDWYRDLSSRRVPFNRNPPDSVDPQNVSPTNPKEVQVLILHIAAIGRTFHRVRGPPVLLTATLDGLREWVSGISRNEVQSPSFNF